MNHAEFENVIAVLQRLCGCFLDQVKQPRRDRIVLVFSDHSRLLLVPRGPFARVHTTARRDHSPKKPFSFQGACRAHLGGRLVGVQKVAGDRVVDLVFTRGTLHLRLTGRGGGLWLMEGERPLAAYDGPAPGELPPLPAPQHDTRAPRFAPREGENWDQAAAAWFDRLEAEAELQSLRTEVSRRLRGEASRLSRLVRALEGDLRAADDAPRLRRAGDALAAHLHELPRRASTLVLSDLEDPDLLHTIEMKPGEIPSVTMGRLYRRAARLERGGDRVLEQLEQAELRAKLVAEALATCPLASREELLALQQELPRQRPPKPAEQRLPWHTWSGPGGRQLLIGRDEPGNRQLTFQKARGDDIWLHIRGVPGPHALLVLPRGSSPPLELLLDAAQLTAMASKTRAGDKVEVQYTEARHVRPVPGSPGARVYVANERVLSVLRASQAPDGWTRHDP